MLKYVTVDKSKRRKVDDTIDLTKEEKKGVSSVDSASGDSKMASAGPENTTKKVLVI